jgi:hypothetical protein
MTSFFSQAILVLVAAWATVANVHAKLIKTRTHGSELPSETFPMIKGWMKDGTRGLRGATASSDLHRTARRKLTGVPSPALKALVRSIAPKSMDGKRKVEKQLPSSTIPSIPQGLLDGTFRQSSGGSTGDLPGVPIGGSTGSNCTAQVSLSFHTDSFSNTQNGMILYDMATYDAATESFTASPIWYYAPSNFTNGREYNLEECLDENACYSFLFFGKCSGSNLLRTRHLPPLIGTHQNIFIYRQTPSVTDLLMARD